MNEILAKVSKIGRKISSLKKYFSAEIDRCKSHLTGPAGSQPMGNPMGQNPAEIFQKLSTDPRTSGFMSDPGYLTMLQELSTNPANAMKHMNDPRMQATLQGIVE